MMMFDLVEDMYDENETEEREHNCPWSITVPSGASHEYMKTNIRSSFQH